LKRRCIVWVVATAALLLLPTAGARAAFPGANGKIAYVDGGAIWTMSPDGSGKTQITTGVDAAPAWSPDGTKIAFHRRIPACTGPCSNIWIASADGSNATPAISSAQYPSWSPGGSKLVFMAGPQAAANEYGHIYRANIDGSDLTLLYDWEDADVIGIGRPAWAPDSSKTIAFHEGTLAVSCNPDLEECANFYPESLYTSSSETHPDVGTGPIASGAAPNWSPNGGKLTFFTPSWGTQEFPGDPGGQIGVIDRDGSQRQLLTPGAGGPGPFDQQPAWAPDGSRVVFARNGDGIHVIHADGTGDVRISTTGSDPDWQAVPVASLAPYVRPKSAWRIRVALVPAYRACTAPNRIHGPSLAFGSCAPPAIVSTQLSVGGATDAAAKSSGLMRVFVVPGSPGPPDDADVQVRLSITNVMGRYDLSDYTGEVQGVLRSRITDRSEAFGPLTHAATMMDLEYTFAAACTATADTTVGSTCSAVTSIDAILPGSGYEGARSVWELDGIEVRDGGPDGDADTPFANTVFMTQGLFVP
jgi:Tol biopolymer transport system component